MAHVQPIYGTIKWYKDVMYNLFAVALYGTFNWRCDMIYFSGLGCLTSANNQLIVIISPRLSQIPGIPPARSPGIRLRAAPGPKPEPLDWAWGNHKVHDRAASFLIHRIVGQPCSGAVGIWAILCPIPNIVCFAIHVWHGRMHNFCEIRSQLCHYFNRSYSVRIQI